MTYSRMLFSTALIAAVRLAGQASPFVISTYSGGLPASTPITGVSAAVGYVQSAATDAAGNVYFASFAPAYFNAGQFGVFKLDPNGVLTRIAGNGGAGFSGDGGPALAAQFLLSDFNGEPGWPGIAVDSLGDIYIADSGNYRVRMVTPAGIVRTVAGNGTASNSGDGGYALSAGLNYPTALTVDRAGNLYVVCTDRLRIIDMYGVISTLLLTPGDTALTTDNSGNVYVSGGGNTQKIPFSGAISTVAAVDGNAIAIDPAGDIYLSSSAQIFKITPNGPVAISGGSKCGYSGDGGPAANAQVCPNGLAFDNQGNLYIADSPAQRIRAISTEGTIQTIAGNGACCFSGDGGPAANAQFNLAPWGGGMTVDGVGNLYIADSSNQRVRKISPGGIVSSVAGNGAQGSSGDGGQATLAALDYPWNVAVDSSGNLYIAEMGSQNIRKVATDGTISTVANNAARAIAVDKYGDLYFTDPNGVHILSPSGGTATLTTTQFNLPFAALVDGLGNYYVAEAASQSYRVRKVSPDGTVTTVAGAGPPGYLGDGGPAVNALLFGPVGLAMDSADNLYIADSFNARIRMVSPGGVITTVAGNGGAGYSGDGGPAISAQVGSLSGLAIDAAGNLYAADQFDNAIRLLQPGTPPILTGALNAASSLPGPIAPGELIVLTGSGLGPSPLVQAAPDSNGAYATQLAGTTVEVNGIAAPVIYASATQVAAVVPDSVALGPAQIAAGYLGSASRSLTIPVVAYAPGIFTADATGQGPAATVNQNGVIDAPAAGGDTITLFLTGVGAATSANVNFGALTFPVSIEPADGAGIARFQIPIPLGEDCASPVAVQVGNASSQAGVILAVNICI